MNRLSFVNAAENMAVWKQMEVLTNCTAFQRQRLYGAAYHSFRDVSLAVWYVPDAKQLLG